jgi:Flp pilus assembly protein TadG
MFKLDDKGNVAIIAALCMPMIVGGAACGIEVGFWRYDQVRVQQAADAAAYAGAVVKRAEGTNASSSAINAAATTAATSNGYASASDSITLNMPSTATPGDANSVEAVITRTEPPIFTAYIRCVVSGWSNSNCASATTSVKSSSTASFSTAGDACILALSPSASKSVDFAGNSAITLNGCSVMSNSLASNALNAQGSSDVTAPCMYSAGGANQGGVINLTVCGAIKTHQPPVADPFASQAIPAPAKNCKNGNNGASQGPDTYCSLSFKGTSTLAAGVYIVDGGTLSVNANANVSGTGVTIVLTNGASISMNGNSHVSLSAPTSGTYSGFLIMSDRSNTGSIQINGDNTSQMTGAIYAPDGNVSYLGNYSGANGCTQIVAQTIQWSGSTTFADDCSAAGMGKVQVGSVVRLSA